MKLNLEQWIQIGGLIFLVVIAFYTILSYKNQQLEPFTETSSTIFNQKQKSCNLVPSAKVNKRVAGCHDYFEYRLIWTPEACQENQSARFCKKFSTMNHQLVPESLRPVVDLGKKLPPRYLENCTTQPAQFTALDGQTLATLKQISNQDYQAVPTKIWQKYGTCSQLLPWFSGPTMYFDQVYTNLFVWITYNFRLPFPSSEQEGELVTTYEDLAYSYSRGIHFATRQQGYSDHLDYLAAECKVDLETGKQYLEAIRIFFNKHLLRYLRIKRPEQLVLPNECDRNAPIFVRENK